MILSLENDPNYLIPAPPKPPEGFKIRRRKWTEVFADIDTKEGLDDWYKNKGLVDQLGAVGWSLTDSKTPGHKHGVVGLSKDLARKIGPAEALLIGVCLGSDKKRALLALRSILNGNEENADLFYEKV